MRHPGAQDIGWGAVLRVNARFCLAVILLFVGWLIWQMASVDWWGFLLLGPMCLAAGGVEALRAGYETVRLIRDRHRWKRFEKLGSVPRADHMVQDSDFGPGEPSQ